VLPDLAVPLPPPGAPIGPVAPPPAPPPPPADTRPPAAPPAPPPSASASPDASLPLALAPLLPAEGIGRDRSEPVTFLVSHTTERREATVLEVILDAGGVRHSIGSFDVPAGPAGVVTSVRGRLRAPPDAPAGAATLRLVIP